MHWENGTVEEILQKLNTNTTDGLTSEEVIARQKRYGLNEFEEEKKENLIQKILHHLKEIPTIILMIAAAIAAYMAIYEGEGWTKVVVIMAVVIMNVVLGIYQENKAEKALEALKKMNAFKTTVIRDGKKQVVEASELVPGDVIELNSGDVITADARLIEDNRLQVEEAALTGESQPAEKNSLAIITEEVSLGDRLNMVYSGCLVTSGRAKAIVVATAMETEMGKIASMLNTTKKQLTPLQLKLRQLAKRISFIALLSGIAMFLVGYFIWGRAVTEILLLAVALGVAAVPETLPIIVTMILSYGVFNMVNKKAIIRKIPAVETIGNTSVICSDKTGTLTQNRMKIRYAWHVASDPISVKEEFSNEQNTLVKLLASCSNATIEEDEDGEHVVGDPTEIAIIRLLHDKGFTRDDIEETFPRVHELPFDSGRKLMTTVHKSPNGGYIAITKGAFDKLPVDWNEKVYDKATNIHDSFAKRALRVISVGYKVYSELPEDLSIENLENNISFLGMVGMIDPPRPESKEAVERAAEAGIRTIMITGDHIETAIAIAKEIGIMDDNSRAITGLELSAMDDEELKAEVKNIAVYARVSPEDKMRIIQAWSSHGDVIAMTGDGVNDAPALKAADVGVAMGITGTEVTKNAADMVITDDNFATIVDAVEEGRVSFDNIRKIIQFLLGVNFAEIFVLLTGMLLLGVEIITATQILIINMVYDGIPGFFLAFEKPEPGVMKRKPIRKGTSIFAHGVGLFIGIRAVSFSILTLTAFAIGSFVEFVPNIPASWGTPNFAVGTTMAFMVLSIASTIDIFNTRTQRSIFKAGFMSNRGLFFTVVGTVIFALVVAIWEPLMNVFSVVRVSGTHWVIIIGLASLQLVAVDFLKIIIRRREAKLETI